MKLIYRATMMVVFLALVIPVSAKAEIKEGSLEMGVFGGYNLFPNSQNLKNRPVFGGRFGYNLTKHFGFEGAIEFISTAVADPALTGAVKGQFRSPIDAVALTFYHVDAVYHFLPDGKFNPFVLIGLGGANYSPTISTHNMAALNIGVGAKYWMTENVALRFDVRDFMPAETFQWLYPNISATVGITIALGGHTQKEISAAEAEPKQEPKVVVIEAEPKAEEQAVVVAAEADEQIVVLAFDDVHFGFNDSTLTEEAKVILTKNMTILKKNPKAKIRIAGFTSASGTEEYNQKLSERRASAVKDYLVKENVVKPNRLSTIGYGQTRPAMYEKHMLKNRRSYTKASTANRRVLFEVVVD